MFVRMPDVETVTVSSTWINIHIMSASADPPSKDLTASRVSKQDIAVKNNWNQDLKQCLNQLSLVPTKQQF